MTLVTMVTTFSMRGVKLAEDGRLLSELLEYSCSIFGRILRRLLDGDSRPDSTP